MLYFIANHSAIAAKHCKYALQERNTQAVVNVENVSSSNKPLHVSQITDLVDF